MNTAVTIACNAIGTAMILATSRGVLRELFHPGGSGGVSSQIQRRWWREDVLRRAQQSLPELGPLFLAPLLGVLESALGQANVDLGQAGISYYFWDDDPMNSIAAALPVMEWMSHEATRTSDSPDVRVAASALYAAIEQFAKTVNATHLAMGNQPRDVLLAAFQRDHHHPDTPLPSRG